MTEPAEFLVMTLEDGSHRVRLDRLTDGRIMCQLCFGHFAVDQLNPVEGGVEDVCKPCARVEFLRGTLAHVTHGTKYHTDANCPRLIHGEGLHDWDGDDYGGGFLAGSYRIVSNIQDAVMRGKLPCLGCVSVALRVFPPLYGQTFGHELFEYDGVPICARCYIQHRGWREAIAWPCTSALVLGLVPREVTA